MKNVEWSEQLLTRLTDLGVTEFVYCAGARNATFISVLTSWTGVQKHSFFEERSGAFFALGVARRTGRPVAIITTSGTASAELLPAMIEAKYTGVPLIAVTADRPRRLRGTGAPQVIDQTGLFAKFVSHEFDLELGDNFDLTSWSRRTPVHINVCLDEPLLDQPASPRELNYTDVAPFLGTSTFELSAGTEWASLRVTKFLRATGPLVVLVGSLETPYEREAVAEFLKRLRVPVYFEGTSGLRERADLEDDSLRSGDKVLSWGLKHNLFSRVLRIGGIPTVRVWRDFEEPTSTVDVLSLTVLPFAGLSRGEMVCADIVTTLNGVNVEVSASDYPEALVIQDRKCEQELLKFFEQEPQSEPALIHALSKKVPAYASVYVGNSLPIREWDLCATYGAPHVVEANRGVNGIDGQISTYLGLARDREVNWAIIGDLTAMYDLSGPWALRCRENIKICLVVVNNSGGRIFSRLFKDEAYENRHAVGFESWAAMWGLHYRKWESVPDTTAFVSPSEEFESHQNEVIEVVPDETATARFWQLYDALWTMAPETK